MVFRRKHLDWQNKVDVITIISNPSPQAELLTGAVCVHCAGVLRLRGCGRTDGGLDTEPPGGVEAGAGRGGALQAARGHIMGKL